MSAGIGVRYVNGKALGRSRIFVALSVVLVSALLAALSAQGQTLTTLYSFQGGTADGANPSARVIRDSAGNLYGTTLYGGGTGCPLNYGCGVIFKLDISGHETVLYRFTGGADGAHPSSLVRDAAGNLYATTNIGGDLACGGSGSLGCGIVFRLSADGQFTVLHTFEGADGSFPTAGVIRDSDGNLYGATEFGGELSCNGGSGCGTVFKLDANGQETVLHRFRQIHDGSFPLAGLVRDGTGNLYGTTDSSYAHCLGTVFRVDKNNKETILHCFRGGADGQSPDAGVIRDAAGNLYGTTFSGGSYGSGTVFRLDRMNRITILHNFNELTDGSNPERLIRDAAGNLFGTTPYDGGGAGTVFKIDASGQFGVLYHFSDGLDGGEPHDGVTRDSDGNLYGTTWMGGANGFGTIFKITP